jgi:hypothetical protein
VLFCTLPGKVLRNELVLSLSYFLID